MKYSVDDNYEDKETYSNTSELRFIKLHEDSIEPIRATDGAAGFDLCAYTDGDTTIQPHQTVRVGTGIAAEIPSGYFGGLFPRSGLSAKKGIRLANCVGVIDSDYRGEIIAALHNDSDEAQTISKGERIVQLVIIPHMTGSATQKNQLSETERGTNGFGSTGRMGIKEHV